MARLQMRQGDEFDQWFDNSASYRPQRAAPRNYDVFLADLYSFYYYRGVRGTLVNTAVQLGVQVALPPSWSQNSSPARIPSPQTVSH